jgi:hypothetical protein
VEKGAADAVGKKEFMDLLYGYKFNSLAIAFRIGVAVSADRSSHS